MRILLLTATTLIFLLIGTQCIKNPASLPDPPGIHIISPTGGIAWDSGNSYEIKWMSSGTSGYVKISFWSETDNDWMLITNSSNDDGSYSWDVPEFGSANCRIQITDVDGNPSAVSDTFSVIGISIIEPQSGSVYAIGSTQRIQWASYGTSGSISIELIKRRFRDSCG